MSIGEAVRRRRVLHKMSQRELGEKIGVTASMITQIERGTKALTVPVALELAEVFKCSLEELIHGIDF